MPVEFLGEAPRWLWTWGMRLQAWNPGFHQSHSTLSVSHTEELTLRKCITVKSNVGEMGFPNTKAQEIPSFNMEKCEWYSFSSKSG